MAQRRSCGAHVENQRSEQLLGKELWKWLCYDWILSKGFGNNSENEMIKCIWIRERSCGLMWTLSCTRYAILTKAPLGAWRWWRKHHLWACLCVCLWMWCTSGDSGLCHLGLLQHHQGGCRGRGCPVHPQQLPRSWKWSWSSLQDHVWHGNYCTYTFIFQFAQWPREAPNLTHKNFKALKLGLSAYSHNLGRAIEITLNRKFILSSRRSPLCFSWEQQIYTYY